MKPSMIGCLAVLGCLISGFVAGFYACNVKRDAQEAMLVVRPLNYFMSELEMSLKGSECKTEHQTVLQFLLHATHSSPPPSAHDVGEQLFILGDSLRDFRTGTNGKASDSK